jgi:PAS domain S-box-containing protein
MASDDTYRIILESIPDAIIVVQEGVVTYANPGAVRLTGYNQETLLQMPFQELVHTGNKKLHAGSRQQDIRLESASGQPTFRLIDPTGNLRWVENRRVSITWENKPADLNILRDITLTRNLAQQLIQAQKMHAVGILAAGIGRDFNNLLNVISGHTQLMMLDRHPDDPEIKRLKEIELAAAKAGDLIRQIMTFSPKSESQLSPVQLNDAVQRFTGRLKPDLPHIEIECRLETGLESIRADQSQIEQMLMHLALNAGTAMPDGGRLRFSTAQRTLDPDFCETHLGARPGTYIQLTISDNGTGMNQETLQRMFEPFYTTGKPKQASGLGLAVVYGIVKNHCGYITCESTPGKGSVFEVYFPLSVCPAEEAPITEKEKPNLPHGSETVLLVDDDNHALEIGREILERFGYSVITADCGEMAMTALAGYVGSIDLVILDVSMPGMGGLGCLKELLSKEPAMRIIMAGGYSPDGAVRKSLESGACGYVAKPFQVYEMINKVREALDI